MSNHLQHRALVDRVGAAFAALFFGVQMLVVIETGHAMPWVPILAVLATPFALSALAVGQRHPAGEPELVPDRASSR